MDLNQRKLNRSEWESIEVPVSAEEKEVLQLIINGTTTVNIKYNKDISLLSYLKVENNNEMEDYLYNKYFDTRIKKLIIKCIKSGKILEMNVNSNPKMKKADLIRLDRNDISRIPMVYETLLLDVLERLMICKEKDSNEWLLHYFTMYKLNRNTVLHVNKHIKQLVSNILVNFEEEINMTMMIENSVEYIEKNELLLRHADMMLYEHQKEIFTILKNSHFAERLEKFREDKKAQDESSDDSSDDEAKPVTIFKTSVEVDIPPITPKLVLYIAPTGTGKTLTPIGLSQQFRVIFVCAARHVGLALARSAISIGKKIAFAFGCASADDIRLHFFAAKEYKKNKKSGGVGKVDNSVGDKVEIMICDVKSYLCAMYYMLAFNPADNIVTCWDEPTISMDREEHDLHQYINKNWKENLIPNMVLSSATLPKLHELPNSTQNFAEKFPGAQIHNIVSHDCKKSIPIINKSGYVVLPHLLSQNYETILEITRHCEQNLTLLRYFDLEEVVKFIIFVEKNNYITSNSVKIDRCFATLDDVTMQNIKLHYLKLLGKIKTGAWVEIYTSLTMGRERRIPQNNSIDEKGNKLKKVTSVGPGIGLTTTSQINAGKPLTKMMSEQIVSSPAVQEKDLGNSAIYVSTKDAYTLTNGPTIFLAEDVEKIAKFCIQQANIPIQAMQAIIEKIEYNNRVNERIDELEKDLETLEEKSKNKVLESDGGGKFGGKNYSKKDDSKKNFMPNENNKDMNKINEELDRLRAMIKIAELNETFVPNKVMHLRKWAESQSTNAAFTSDIDDQTVIEIMMLKNVADNWKILLLMGIGVFTNHPDITYTEIMKKLADTQKLYMIIASSDYIYGTNYQFCHGYLSKDLILTQEKMVQALGRIGRNNIQQTYSVRLRDDEQITKLFYVENDKPEVKNMNKLFS